MLNRFIEVFEEDLADLTAEPGRQIERWLGSQNAADRMSDSRPELEIYIYLCHC
jgi:hypothetical protein